MALSSTGTRKPRDVQSRTTESIIEIDKEFINSLKIFSESSNEVAGLVGAAINNSPKTPAGNYLAREGDSMIGPIAFGPPVNFRIEVDANNTIDIGPLNENIQYTSNIQLDDLQPNSSTLDIIANANFDGQVLVLRTFAPTVAYTIRQGTLGNGGNIQTFDGSDVTMGDLQTIVLVFDESLIIGANTGGTWRMVAGTLVNSNVPDGTAQYQHLEWNGSAWNAQQVLQFGADHADAGNLRFPNNTVGPAWRNNANTDNIRIFVDVNDDLQVDQADNLELINNATGASGIANFVSWRDDATPTTGDELGSLRFDGNNDAVTPERIQYMSILAGIADVVDGSEDGQGLIRIAEGGSLVNYMAFNLQNDGNVGILKPIEMPEVTTPANPPANSGILYVKDVAGTTSLFFLDSAGTDTNLLSGGGSQTPWLSNIDADGFSLQDLGAIEFRENVTEPASTISYIVKETVNLVSNVVSGDGHLWKIGGTQVFGLGPTTNNCYNDLDMNSNKLLDVADGTISTDGINKGQLDAAVTGFQDYSIWITHETTQFDFEVFMTNSKTAGTISGSSLTEDTLIFVPFWLGQRARLSEMGFETTVDPGGTYTVAMGIYSNRSDGQNYPDTKLADNNTIFSGLGAKTVVGFAEDLEVGLYWLAIVCTTDAITIGHYSAGDTLSVGYRLDLTGTDSFDKIMGYTMTQTSTTLPTNPDDEMVPLTGAAVAAIYAKFLLNPN